MSTQHFASRALLPIVVAISLSGGCSSRDSSHLPDTKQHYRIAGPVPAALAARLPLASGEPVEPAPLVAITEEAVSVDGEATITLRLGRFPRDALQEGMGGLVAGALHARLLPLAKRSAATAMRACFLLAAAETIPYETVRTVLHTASRAGFGCYQIAVAMPPESRATLNGIRMALPSALKPARERPWDSGTTSTWRDPWNRLLRTSRDQLRPAPLPRRHASVGPFGSLYEPDELPSAEPVDDHSELSGQVAEDEFGVGGAAANAPSQDFRGWGGFGKGGGELGTRPAIGEESTPSGSESSSADKPVVLMSRATVTGGLDAATIRRMVRRHLSEIRYCYVSVGLPWNPQLEGMIQVRFVITARGEVDQAAVASSTLKSEPMEKCIVSAVGHWRFPKPEGAMPSVTFPFHFKRGR